MNKKQQESIDRMLHTHLLLSGQQLALSFFEKRLGVVNTHVIDFRKSLEKEENNFKDAVSECSANGALNEIMKLI